mmetsp:Transcript_35482/g.80036  ORF Transcript_35482/g.80036 Transcript_35482/m.80036 type:complete len:810 (+) Transcript_35482:76-2505(+)
MFHHRSSQKAPKPKRARSSSIGAAGTRASIKKVNLAALSKQDRLNTLRQVRQSKSDDLWSRRQLATASSCRPDDRPIPPKVVAVVAFHEHADASSLKRYLANTCLADQPSDMEVSVESRDFEARVVALPSWAGVPGLGKQRLMFIDVPRDEMAVLDVAKCADLVICALGPTASLENPSFDELGYKFLTALKAQGLPLVLGAIHGGAQVPTPPAKKVAEVRKLINRYFISELGADAKLYPCTSYEEAKVLVRALACATPKDMSWRTDRGYLLANEAEYHSAQGLLCLKGYVRGPGFLCKHLVHLTGHGDFTLSQIAILNDPCPTGSRHGSSEAAEPKLVDRSNPDVQPDRQRLQPYDPSMAEQTFPTNAELAEAKQEQRRRRGAAQLPGPKGAAGGDQDDTMEADDGADDGMESDDSIESGGGMSKVAETDDGWDVSSNMTMEVPSSEAVEAERRRREVLVERSQEELEFPDEVDTPLDIPAKERFQKYRGLKSFRTSPWDPYEDLPVEYSRVWEFESFNAANRGYRHEFTEDCGKLNDEGIDALYCAIVVEGVPATVMESQKASVPFILSSLFPCEQKVSVVHASLCRHREYDGVIKSKQEVVLQAGFRRFPAKPIYSEIPKRSSQCKKYKFMRFLHPDTTTCASFYAPIMFPPTRVMMFVHPEAPMEDAKDAEEAQQVAMEKQQQQKTGELTLAASGAITSADPKQLIIKRSILTGYPFRVHKSKAVVRFMFFTPSDIRWFKPVELTSKRGLRGHIVESLGTHGYMKCRFNAHIKQDDTVCMLLYKRVYPKWFPPSWGGRPEDTPEDP